MNRRQELLRQFAYDPQALADHALALEAEQQRLQQEQQALQRERAALQQRVSQAEAQLAQAAQALEEEKQKLAEAQAVIAELKHQLFGAQAEKLTPEQEEQLQKLAGEVREQAQEPTPVSQEVLEETLREETRQQRQRAKRRRRHHLPPVELEKRTVILEPEDKLCPNTGKERPRIGQEVTTEYDYEPAKLIIRETVRPKYGECDQNCCQGVAIAPLPPRLVPQSLLGLGLAVYLLLSRFDDHVAYYTLERNFRERHGVSIPRQQMVQWVEKVAHLLLGVYRAIWDEMKAGVYLQIDETPVRVLDPEVKGKAGRGYLWFYSVPGGDVFLEFCGGRGREGPELRLRGFHGTIQTDAYAVYESLRKESPGRLKRLGCLGHARRRFYKALQESLQEGLWFILKIRELYRIEDQLRDCGPQERRRGRLAKAPVLWLEMKRRAQALKKDPHVLPGSTLGKAVRYFLKEYTAMVGYLRDGRFEIDNILVENDVRPSAVGRKRWLFIGHPQAGWRSAVIYTIIQSCRRRGINPQEYLTDVLQRLPSMMASQVRDLTPSRWKALRSQPTSDSTD
jgi:transposase